MSSRKWKRVVHEENLDIIAEGDGITKDTRVLKETHSLGNNDNAEENGTEERLANEDVEEQVETSKREEYK